MNCPKGTTAVDTSEEIKRNQRKRICRGQLMLRVDVNSAKNEGDGGGSGGGSGGGTGGGSGGGGWQDLMSPPAGVHHGHHRRESFLYRPEVLDGELSPTRSRQSSRCDSSPLDDLIVTPLAQLIDSLRKVKSNYLMLLKIPQIRQTSSKDFEAVHFSLTSETPSSDESRQRIAMETLEELEWCLDQLENIQTDRSANQITTNKFKRMLNRELYQYVECDKGRSQVSRYISRTFIDDTEADHEEMLAHEPETREDLRRMKGITKDSPGQPETSGLLTLKDNAKALIRKKCVTYYPINCSAQAIPKYGVKTKDEEQLSQQLQHLNIWGMDMFKLAKAAANKPLTAVTYTILKERGLLETFRISPGVLLNFLSNLENHYRTDNPYHNSLHAADVTQSSHVLLLLPAFRNIFTDLEILATIFASAAHDVDHPGLNSQFLINSNSELALLYNDESVLENHHLAVAFQLLQQEKCDVFSNLSKKQRQHLRHLVIGMVLATDMSKHVDHLANLKTMVELRRLSGNSRIELENPCHKQQILKSLVHCADLSNPTKSWEVYSNWTDKVMEEFFRQGDKEKQLGLDVSPMCDRDTARIASAQVGFIDFVVRPLWETWADLVYPDCQQILDAIESNRQHHQQLLDNDQHPQHNHHPDVA